MVVRVFEATSVARTVTVDVPAATVTTQLKIESATVAGASLHHTEARPDVTSAAVPITVTAPAETSCPRAGDVMETNGAV